MELTVLGCKGGYPNENVGTSGYLIQTDSLDFVVDFGSDNLLTLEEIYEPDKLDMVLLSHYHHDHIADVGVLGYYRQLHTKNIKKPILPIYGPFKNPILDSFEVDGFTRVETYNPNVEFHINGINVKFMKTIHPVPAFAMRITEDSSGKSIGYTSDTEYFDGLIDFFEKVDLLITDTNFGDEVTHPKNHMNVDESVKLFNKTNSNKLLLSHLPQGDSVKESLMNPKYDEFRNKMFMSEKLLKIKI